jgi:hypothetical protein
MRPEFTMPRGTEHTPPSGHPSQEGNQAHAGQDLNPLLRGVARSDGVCSREPGKI